MIAERAIKIKMAINRVAPVNNLPKNRSLSCMARVRTKLTETIAIPKSPKRRTSVALPILVMPPYSLQCKISDWDEALKVKYAQREANTTRA